MELLKYRSAIVVAILLLVTVSCVAGHSYKDKLDELSRWLDHGSAEEMKIALEGKRPRFNESELSFTLNLAVGKFCWSKANSNLHNSEILFSKIQVLVEVGASSDGGKYPDMVFPTPIMRAISCNALDVIRYLVDHGAKLSIRDPGGNTLLHIAACRSNAAVIEYLEARGLSRGAVGHLNKTPLDISIECKNTAAVEYFKNR